MDKIYRSDKLMIVMLVTVVIPAYNEEKYIEKTLQAIVKQTYKDIEIIVADNNSTDHTAALAKKYGAHVIQVPKQGAVFAYDTGMKAAKGEIIVNIDADTIPPHDWVENIVKTLQPEDVIAVTGTATVKSNFPLLQQLGQFLFTAFLYSNFLIGKPHISGFNFGVKKKAFTAVGGMDTKYFMSFEVDLGLRLKKVGKVVFKKNLCVITSTRRWNKQILKALGEYTKGYIYAVWLRKPPPFKQDVLR